MQKPFESTLSGLAALLIVGIAMTAVVAVPPTQSPVQAHDAAFAVPILA